MIAISIDKFELLIDKNELNKALKQVGNQVKAKAQQLIRAPKSGKQYGDHVASAPGEAPATLTGALASSMKVKVKRNAVTITDVAYYAVMLEAGSKGGGRGKGGESGASTRSGRSRTPTTGRVIEPRPYLSQALEEVDVQGVLDKALETIITSRTTFK